MGCSVFYSGMAIPRNAYQMDCGVCLPNPYNLRFAVHNNSALPQNVYGVFYMTVGF